MIFVTAFFRCQPEDDVVVNDIITPDLPSFPSLLPPLLSHPFCSATVWFSITPSTAFVIVDLSMNTVERRAFAVQGPLGGGGSGNATKIYCL